MGTHIIFGVLGGAVGRGELVMAMVDRHALYRVALGHLRLRGGTLIYIDGS